MKTEYLSVLLFVSTILAPFTGVTIHSIMTNESAFKGDSPTTYHNLDEAEPDSFFLNFIPDPSFKNDSTWNFSSISLISSDIRISNDTKGSWGWDYDSFTKETRSVKLTISDNSSTPLYYRHKTSVRGVTSFAYNYSVPTRVYIKFDLRCTYNGNDPNYIAPYVQIVKPEESPFPAYLSRAEIEPPYHNVWRTYTRNISLLGYNYAFQKDVMVDVVFGLEWSNTASNPYNSVPVPSENGTAIAWFDNIQVIVANNCTLYPDMTSTTTSLMTSSGTSTSEVVPRVTSGLEFLPLLAANFTLIRWCKRKKENNNFFNPSCCD